MIIFYLNKFMVSSKIINSIIESDEYVNTLNVQTLTKVLQHADDMYYNGNNPIFTDDKYDTVKEILLKKNGNYEKIGAPVKGSKVKLPVWMGSMDKKKKVDKEFNMKVVISDKLDGVSCLIKKDDNTIKLYTRGDGQYGKDITFLIDYIRYVDIDTTCDYMVRGELIMTKSNFQQLQSKESNARNTVSGFVNSKTPNPKLHNIVDFIVYEVLLPKNKSPSDQARFVEEETKFKLVHQDNINNVNDDILKETLNRRKKESEYEIDGIIVSEDVVYEQITKGNPKHAFAYKQNDKTASARTRVISVEWNVSKDGYLKPIVHFEEICLNNVFIKQATGFNAKFISDNKIGKDSVILVERSGEVIPNIVSIEKESIPDFPDVDYKWNTTGVDIVLVGKTDIHKRKIFQNMLEKLKIDNLGKGTIIKLYENGVKDLNRLYNLKISDITELDGFSDTSAKKLLDSINARKNEITCLEYMIASNCFGRGFAEKKLQRILDTGNAFRMETDELIKVDGIGEKTAELFIQGLKNFKMFLESQNITHICKEDTKQKSEQSGKMKNMIIVFTGIRDKELEEYIKKNGGIVATTITKNVTLVVYKDKTTTKVEKAKKYNIKIQHIDDFKNSVYT